MCLDFAYSLDVARFSFVWTSDALCIFIVKPPVEKHSVRGALQRMAGLYFSMMGLKSAWFLCVRVARPV